jgi:mycothiol synthase
MPIRHTDADDLTVIASVLVRAGTAKGFDLSEEAVLDLLGEAPQGFLAEVDGSATGYAHLRAAGGDWEIEIALAPDCPESLVSPLLERSLQAAGDRGVVWTIDAAVDAAAASLGLHEVRTIYRLKRPLPLDPAPPVPAGLEITPLDPDADLDAFLVLNSAAFAGHPENSAWTRATVEERMQRSWYDPGGFFLGRTERRVIGACWTKLHLRDMGEIYLIAVAPEAQGRGIGAALIGHGLGYLHEARGATGAMVYTEAGNRRGLGLYTNLGFEIDKIRRCWGSGV